MNHIVSLLIAFSLVGYANAHSLTDKDYKLFSPDSIPDPPPEPQLLSGCEFACIGDTCNFHVDVPIGCSLQWSLNGIILPDTTTTLQLIWTQSGLQLVEATFLCTGYPPSTQSIEVNVGPPLQPGPITGDNPVCEFTTHEYTTTVGSYDSCEWSVNGIVLPVVTPTLTYTFGSQGDYLVEVKAYNYCGISPSSSLNVTAQKLPEVYLGPDTTIFQGQVLILDAGNPGCTYLWSTGATTQTIAVTTAGIYNVNVDNSCGTAMDEIQVGVIVNLREQGLDQVSFQVDERSIRIIDPADKVTAWRIFSSSGRLLTQGISNETFNAPHGGIYFLAVQAGNSIKTFKIAVF